MTPLLITIGPRHDCEKARWALQRAHIAFRESARAPVKHLLRTVLAGQRSTPLLMADGEVIADSTDILVWVDKRTPPALRLFPDDPAARTEVDRWEDLFDKDLGPAVHRASDFHKPSFVPDPVAVGKLQRVLGQVDEALATGRGYLVGERFSAADLTFAALAAPVLQPGNPDLVNLPPAFAALVREVRGTQGGRFGLRLLREERGQQERG